MPCPGLRYRIWTRDFRKDEGGLLLANTMRIVVLGLQGAFFEHARSVERAMSKMGIEGNVVIGKRRSDFGDADGIVLPGGESTTINRLLHSSGIWNVLKGTDAAILATCAGMVLISSGGDEQCKHTGELLGLIDMKVNRNAFGRQRESFEKEVFLEGIGKLNGVFIRAPCIESIRDPDAKVIGRIDERIIAVEKKKILALAFHPELGDDLKVHKRFLELAR